MENYNEKLINQLTAKLQGKEVAFPPPTQDFALKVAALFSHDPDVYTIFTYGTGELKVLVKGEKKAEAINYLLGHANHSEIKNIVVKVFLIREDGSVEELPTPTWNINVNGYIQYMKDAFKGAGFQIRFDKVYIELFDTTYFFAQVEPKVLSWKNDNIGNPHGYTSALLTDIIKDCLDTGIVMVSTYVSEESNEFGNELGYAFNW